MRAKTLVATTIALLSLQAGGLGQSQDALKMPTWQAEIAKGYVPHHQLTVEDFPVNDRVHADSGLWIKPFIHAQYHFLFHASGLVYADVIDWVVFSGLDMNETSRRSRFHNMTGELPYAQAILDMNELCARELAALKAGDLPRGSGPTVEAAKRNLQIQIDFFLKGRYEKLQADNDAFVKATNRGQDVNKVRELAAAIRKRLDTLPLPVPTPPQIAPSLSATPAPPAIARPSPLPFPK